MRANVVWEQIPRGSRCRLEANIMEPFIIDIDCFFLEIIHIILLNSIDIIKYVNCFLLYNPDNIKYYLIN